MNLTYVQNLEDPRLDDYRSLKDRDIAKTRGGFVAEGLEVVNRLLLSPWSIRSVLVAEARLSRLVAALHGLAPEVPVFVAPMERMSKLVGFPVHRGVLAVGERSSGPSVQSVLGQLRGRGPASALALIQLANHDNVGACFRNAAALGACAVFFDDRTADPLYRRSLRVSMGNTLRVPFAMLGSAQRVFDLLEEEAMTLLALSPGGLVSLDELIRGQCSLPQRFVLMLGSEGYGLPNELLRRAQMTLRIPMSSGTDSLNVATSAAVAMQVLRYLQPSSFSPSSSSS